MALHLYLIRHGETAWAISKRHTGSSDLPLTSNGENEARELGPHLAGIAFSKVLVSPLKRARDTCKLVALDRAPEIEPDLAEWNYGDYEGRQSVHLQQERPGWDLFRDGCPNGESPNEILTRVDRLIARLRTLDGNVALFSHGQLGGVLGARWIGLPLEKARHFPLGTASVSVMGCDPDHPEISVLSLWNFLSHHSLSLPGQTMKQRAIQRWENEGGEIPTSVQTPALLRVTPHIVN